MQQLQNSLKTQQEENAELRHAIALNKQIIREFDSFDDQTYQKLIDQLYQENLLLRNMNKQMVEQRDEARTQSLVNEQIAEGAQLRENEILFETDQKIQNYKCSLEEKQQFLERIETKMKELSIDSFSTMKSISTAHSQLLLAQEIDYISTKIKKLLKENQQGVVLSAKKKDKQKRRNSIEPEQKKAYPIQKKFTLAQTPAGNNVNTLFTSPNKLQQQYQMANETNKQTVKDLQQCRLKLQDEIMAGKMMEDEIAETRERLRESEELNEMLIKSQMSYERKWKRIQRQFNYYYGFYSEQQQEHLEGERIHPLLLSPRMSQGKVMGTPTPPSLLKFSSALFQPEKSRSVGGVGESRTRSGTKNSKSF